MKPPVIIACLKFRRYPESKPEETYDHYNVIMDNGFTDTLLWDYNHWAKSERFPDNYVIAFANLPAVDLDAEEFDFATAVELMMIHDNNECVYCLQSMASQRKIRIVKAIIPDGYIFLQLRHGQWIETSGIYLIEILGKWRLAT